MDVEEFARWLKLGLGRAVLHLQTHDSTPYREIILNACLNYIGYDRQTDCQRDEFMFDVIKFGRDEGFYREKILSALQGNWEDWDSQVLYLALHFARAGDTEARHVLYDTFTRNVSIDHAHGDALIQLDGIAGFAFVARQIGTQLLTGEDSWQDDHLLYALKKQLNNVETTAEISAYMSTDEPVVSSFVKAVIARQEQDERARRERPTPSIANYDDFRSLAIDGPKSWISPTTWGQTATVEDLLRAAKDLLKETEPAKIRKLLRVFWRRLFPLAPDRLIELAQSSDSGIAARAATALALITHPSVREFALQLLHRTSGRGWFADLLIKHYENGDHAIVEGLVADACDEDETHQLGIGVRQFLEIHPNPEAEVRILTHLYEKNPCSFCRERTAERLIELDSLPDWMARECLWDANLDTRKLVKDYLQQANSVGNQQSEITNQQSRSV